MDFFETIPDLPQIMRNTTNAFLAGVRTIAPEVEDFQDVAHLVARHPEHDAAICPRSNGLAISRSGGSSRRRIPGNMNSD
jgi:hypothetical protein